MFRRIMSNWFLDYHHALQLRLLGMVLLLGVFVVVAALFSLARGIWPLVRRAIRPPAWRGPVRWQRSP
jgi:hypothetical protein